MNDNSIKGMKEALNQNSFRTSFRSGFTLIELLVVVLIIGILSAIALPQYQTAVERSRATEALTQMAAISDAMQRYHAQHEAWPPNNAFNKLDVDIPTFTSGGETLHGGKNFSIGFGSDSSTVYAQISASRRRAKHSYTLITNLTAKSDGTYSAVRSCSFNSEDTEAEGYCNAITGGNNSDF